MAGPAFGKRLNVLTVCLIAFAATSAALVFGATKWRPDPSAYPVQGIDVSSDQGEISWPSVATDTVDFAYIRATEGADIRDPRFASNWQGASRAGLQYGAYHAYSLCRLASDQASNFISTMVRDASALPTAISLEFENGCTERPDRGVLIGELATFIKMVEAHTGKPVLLMLTSDFEEAYQLSTAIDRSLWLRRVAFPPDFGARPWVIWQASTFRRVDGIDGATHWNVVRDQ